MADLVFAPGVNKETTPLTVGRSYVDTNLIRSRNGKIAPMGGWTKMVLATLTGVCRTIKKFSNNVGLTMFAFGTNTNVYILSFQQLYDITPAPFLETPGLTSAQVATGYGVGAYSDGTYGTARTAPVDPYAQTVQQPLIWSIDNFGEDLILNPWADIGNPGPIYIWDSANAGFAQRATRLDANPAASQITALARGIFVNIQTEQLVAISCCPLGQQAIDPMQIRWSDLQNPYEWNPTQADSAGGYRLPKGSYIVGWLATYYETIIWTDTTVYSMQYTANDLVFGFQPIADGISMISPRAGMTNGSVIVWMDTGSFYIYSGSVQELPCPLKNFLFGNSKEKTSGDINQFQAFKIYAAHNHSFSEFLWFYQSQSGSDIDSYVMYNYREGIWFNGRLPRSAWTDAGQASTPIATSPEGVIYLQENSNDADDLPLQYSATTGDVDSGTDEYLRVIEMLPDFQFTGTAGSAQQFLLDVRVRESSQETPRVVKTYTITPNTPNEGRLNPNVRGRRISFRIYNETFTGTFWVDGTLKVKYVPSGTR